MKMEKAMARRKFLQAAAVASGGACLTGCASTRGGAAEEHGGEEEVSPAEDLMREHGVLKRVLLTYREALRRIATREDLPPEALGGG